jgi:ATP-dependent DNA helicase DinG
VNHHLLLADLALKEGGFGDLLPGTDAVIVDEAHQLPDVAQQFFGVAVGSRELESLTRDSFAEAQLAGVAGDVVALDGLSRAILDVRRAAQAVALGRVPWIAVPRPLRDSLAEVRHAVETLLQDLERLAEASAGLRNCAERCATAATRLRFISAAAQEEGLRWLDVSPGAVTAHWTPLDVGAALAARIESQGGVWVFTSATLAVARAAHGRRLAARHRGGRRGVLAFH